MPESIRASRVTHKVGGKVMTKQSDTLATDINALMAKYVEHDQSIPAGEGTPNYGDFSTFTDYHTSLNQVHQAQEQFMKLPSAVRAHVNHDPGEFLQMIYDPDRRQELVDLGMAEERVPKEAPPATEKPKEPAPPDPPVPTE